VLQHAAHRVGSVCCLLLLAFANCTNYVAEVLSDANRALLKVIRETKPQSVAENRAPEEGEDYLY
jgi:predicted transcriptional regulator